MKLEAPALPPLTAVLENLVLNRFFSLETSTGASVSRVKSVSGWDPSGFPEKMRYYACMASAKTEYDFAKRSGSTT